MCIRDRTSATGIGGLTATADAWPAEVVVRLHLRGLEGLTIRYGHVIITSGVSSTGDPVALTLSVVDEEGNVQSASPSYDIYYPDIRAVTPDGAAEVGPLAAGERPAFPLPEGSAFETVSYTHLVRLLGRGQVGVGLLGGGAGVQFHVGQRLGRQESVRLCHQNGAVALGGAGGLALGDLQFQLRRT